LWQFMPRVYLDFESIFRGLFWGFDYQYSMTNLK
jgi:hypothetical protein